MIAIVHYTNHKNQDCQAIVIGCETEGEAIERCSHFVDSANIDRIDLCPSDKIINLTPEEVEEL